MSELKVLVIFTTMLGLIICLTNWNSFTEGYRWAVALFVILCVILNLVAAFLTEKAPEKI